MVQYKQNPTRFWPDTQVIKMRELHNYGSHAYGCEWYLARFGVFKYQGIINKQMRVNCGFAFHLTGGFRR